MDNMTIAVGITGSLGTGKTTVALMFKDLGAKVFDADKIAHDLIRENKPCYKPLIQLLGKGIMTNTCIDRKKVAEIVFKNNRLLKKVEKIIHPEVIKVIQEKVEKTKANQRFKKRVLVFDVPLLFESNLNQLMDLSIVVKAKKEQQILRASRKLGITKKEALLRIDAQMPLQEKVKRADKIIINNKDLNNTKKQVKKVWQEIFQIMENE